MFIVFRLYVERFYMNKTGLKEFLKIFSVHYNAIDINDIWDIHRCLMKETWHKIMFGFIKKIFIKLLSVFTIVSH